MIIGRTAPVRFQGPLGDVVSDQTPSEAVKRVQRLMQSISALTATPDYDPSKDTPGKVGFYTASGLYAMSSDFVKKGVPAIPVVGGISGSIVNLLQTIPGVSDVAEGIIGNVDHCLRDRRGGISDPCSFEAAWDAIKLTAPDKLKQYVINPIRSGAASIDAYLKPIDDRLKSGGTPGAVAIQPLVMKWSPSGVQYPPGTVGVRDPILGKFRLIAPPK
jgi:hypothetical protein